MTLRPWEAAWRGEQAPSLSRRRAPMQPLPGSWAGPLHALCSQEGPASLE